MSKLTFYAQIPDTRKAFEIPGSRSEARLLLVMGEDQVPHALKLILLRGQLFKMVFQAVEIVVDEKNAKTTYKNRGSSLETLGGIAGRDSAIRINGIDGMSVQFAIPTLNEKLLVQLLGLREKYLRVTIT